MIYKIRREVARNDNWFAKDNLNSYSYQDIRYQITINARNQRPTVTYHITCQRYHRPVRFGKIRSNHWWLPSQSHLFEGDRFRLPPSSGLDIVLHRATDEHNVVSEPRDIFVDFRYCAYGRTGATERVYDFWTWRYSKKAGICLWIVSSYVFAIEWNICATSCLPPPILAWPNSLRDCQNDLNRCYGQFSLPY